MAGITDIGAFEQRLVPQLVVDTWFDTGARACNRAGAADCSLRGAVTLANAMAEPAVIRFDERVFAEPRKLMLTRPLPAAVEAITLDASGTADVALRGDEGALRSVREGGFTLSGMEFLPAGEAVRDTPGGCGPRVDPEATSPSTGG